MSQLNYNQLFENIDLFEMFPLGLLSEHNGSSKSRAYEAFRTIENLVDLGAQQNYLLSRYSLLQLFPRMLKTQKEELFGNIDILPINDFVKKYLLAITPYWYEAFVNQLTDDESEVFLKNYLTGHETWGHEHGMRELIRTMLECVLHGKVRVKVNRIEKQIRRIPEQIRSNLGKRNSVLGKDLLMGRKFFGRPDKYEIVIGPISNNELIILQNSGWADGKFPSKKLQDLAGFAEPYFMNSDIQIILAMRGFKLNSAILGKSNLGEVVDD